MPEIAYIDDENILQIVHIRDEAVEYIVHVMSTRYLLFPVICAYFSAISLITSRHGSFICIIRQISSVDLRGQRTRSCTYVHVHTYLPRRISFALSCHLDEGNRSSYFSATWRPSMNESINVLSDFQYDRHLGTLYDPRVIVWERWYVGRMEIFIKWWMSNREHKGIISEIIKCKVTKIRISFFQTFSRKLNLNVLLE